VRLYPKEIKRARHQWLMSIILAPWEAEIKGIMVPGQPRQNKVHETPSRQKKAGHGGNMPVIPRMR
jgi:hypothetical protein